MMRRRRSRLNPGYRSPCYPWAALLLLGFAVPIAIVVAAYQLHAAAHVCAERSIAHPGQLRGRLLAEGYCACLSMWSLDRRAG